MPGQAVLPDFSPEALSSRAASERSLRERAEAVTGELSRNERLLRDQLLDRLTSSIDLIDAGEAGSFLGSLGSPFQRIRHELRSPAPAPEPDSIEEADLAEAEAKWEDSWKLKTDSESPKALWINKFNEPTLGFRSLSHAIAPTYGGTIYVTTNIVLNIFLPYKFVLPTKKASGNAINIPKIVVAVAVTKVFLMAIKFES